MDNPTPGETVISEFNLMGPFQTCFEKEKRLKGKQLLAILSIVGVMGFSSMAYAEWNFGIGTGPQRLSIDGDIGMNTALGAVELDVDIDADDMDDMTDNAFGLGGYATDGKWMIQGFVGQLQLEENATTGTSAGGTLTADVDFDITGAELTVGYPIYNMDALMLRAYTGVRYTRHDFDALFTGTAFSGANRRKSIDESWTDVLIGLSADVPFAEKWNWNIKADAGFGGSEGTYLASTGVTWRFWRGFSATLFGKYVAVDFENGSKGDADWYHYDVDETTLGLTLMYNW
jgi:hypothetical protein